MATRSKYVFVTLPELDDWLRATTDDLNVTVVLYRGPTAPLEPWDGRRGALAQARRVFLASPPVEPASVRADDLKLGRLGWLQLDVPREEGRDLLACQIAARSDWYDPDARKVIEDRAGLLLFDRFWRGWKDHFTFPVLARNRATGDEASYPSIGYSPGAAEWARGGGRLRQEGVANVEFLIPPIR